MTEDDAWLEARHARWNTPVNVLDAVVRRATGSPLVSDERVIEGEINEVHAVRTAAGDELIIRIGRNPAPAFDRERWPIAAARDAGLPVPEILLIEHHPSEADAAVIVSFCVQRRLPGVSIARRRPRLRDGELAAFTRTSGRLLARVHEIAVTGRGPITPDGHPATPDGKDDLDRVDGLAAYVVERGVDLVLARAAADAVTVHRPLLDAAPLTLVHGDWSLQHFLVEGNRITGIVDWEAARGDDPAADIAYWDLWFDDGPTATDVLLAGYAEAGGSLGGDFEVRRWCRGIVAALSATAYYAESGRTELVQAATARLANAVTQLRRPP